MPLLHHSYIPNAQVIEELGCDVSERALLKRLRKLKLVRSSSSSKRRSQGSTSKVPVKQLQDLYEQFKDQVGDRRL